jgi:hypothetical protein
MTLVNKNGYLIYKWQLLPRFAFFFVYLAAYLIFGLAVGITVLFTLALISFLMTIFTSDAISFQDLISGTRTIDTKNSVWHHEKPHKEIRVEGNL